MTGIIFWNMAFAQEAMPPYWKAIQQFKNQDSTSFPGKGKILLLGSSTFTRWKNAQEAFPDYPLINRGFGGSKLGDLIRYVPDIVDPYAPKQVVIYCGNDVANPKLTAKDISELFIKLFKTIRQHNKNVPITFISIRPEPKDPDRPDRVEKKKEVNRLIQQFLAKKKYTGFINVYDKMFNEDGSMMDLYVPDGHMNEKGYQLWQRIMEPYLIK